MDELRILRRLDWGMCFTSSLYKPAQEHSNVAFKVKRLCASVCVCVCECVSSVTSGHKEAGFATALAQQYPVKTKGKTRSQLYHQLQINNAEMTLLWLSAGMSGMTTIH